MSFELDIHCDVCGETVFYCSQNRVPGKYPMIRMARNKGWSIGKYHLCPGCKKKRRQLIADGRLS